MALYDELPTPFAWYDRLKKQDRFRRNAPDSPATQLMVPNNTLLPFQFRLVKSLSMPEYWKVFKITDLADEVGTLVKELEITDLKKDIYSNLDYIYFKANSAIKIKDQEATLNLPCGFYYCQIKVNGLIFYSEVFTASDSLVGNEEYVLLEWTNQSAINPVYYGDGYSNRLFLKTFITDGTQLLESETEKDGYGNDILVSQSLKETWEIAAGLLPLFMKRALSFLTLNDNVTLLEYYSGRFGNIYNVKIKTGEEYGKGLTEVDISFDQNDFIFKATCDGVMIPDGGEDSGPNGYDGIIDDGENNDELNYIDI